MRRDQGGLPARSRGWMGGGGENAGQSLLLCARRLGKSMLVLIGFLDAGFVLPFLPAEMAFTWKA